MYLGPYVSADYTKRPFTAEQVQELVPKVQAQHGPNAAKVTVDGFVRVEMTPLQVDRDLLGTRELAVLELEIGKPKRWIVEYPNPFGHTNAEIGGLDPEKRADRKVVSRAIAKAMCESQGVEIPGLTERSVLHGVGHNHDDDEGGLCTVHEKDGRPITVSVPQAVDIGFLVGYAAFVRMGGGGVRQGVLCQLDVDEHPVGKKRLYSVCVRAACINLCHMRTSANVCS